MNEKTKLFNSLGEVRYMFYCFSVSYNIIPSSWHNME